jgi:hypothetical protein
MGHFDCLFLSGRTINILSCSNRVAASPHLVRGGWSLSFGEGWPPSDLGCHSH